ncbi:MAG: PTS transporter subunit EIIC [Erysipelotrichaceae bacterium]
MEFQELAKLIVAEVGGKQNITHVNNCATRLRLTLNDYSLVNIELLQKTEGILDVVKGSGQLQIVIGPEVGHLVEAVNKVVGEVSAPVHHDKKQKPVGMVFDFVTGVFTPILPVITAAGMLSAFLAILVMLGVVDKTSQTYLIIRMVADAAFYFMPVMLAFSTATKLKCNPYLATLFGGVLLHPSFAGLFTNADGVSQSVALFGIPVTFVKYGSSVVPIILIVIAMSYAERFADRVSPKAIKVILKPLIIMLIITPLALCVLGPMGYFIGSALTGVISFLDGVAPWLVPTVIGAFAPLLIGIGAHHALSPILTQQMAAFQYETIMGPGFLAANIAQGASCLAVALKTKNQKMKQLATSASLTALFGGISEPAMFGVTSKLKRPLIAVMIAGGIAGFYAGISGLVRYALGAPSLLTLPLYIGENPQNIINAIITAAIAFVISFILTFVLGFEDLEEE